LCGSTAGAAAPKRNTLQKYAKSGMMETSGIAMQQKTERILLYIGSANRDLQRLPEEIKEEF